MAQKVYPDHDTDAEEDFFNTISSSISEAEKKEMEERAQQGAADDILGASGGADDEGLTNYMQENSENASSEAESLDGYFKDLNAEDKARPRGPGQRARMALRKRRNKILLGMLGGLLPVVGTFISLPYQLTNLSSLLQQFHFSINEDVGESRTTRLIRYMRYQNEPDAAARRRLSIVGNAIADRVETKMRALGYTPNYSEGIGLLESIDVDANNRALIADLEADGLRATESPREGTIRFQLDAPGETSPRQRRNNLKSIVRRNGHAKLSGLHTRVLIRKGGITLRPMGLLPRGTRDDLATRVRDWKDRRTERRQTGIVEQPRARVADPGEDASDADRAAFEADQERLNADLERQRAAVGAGTPAERISRTRARLLGGAVAGIGGVGLLCTIRQLDEQADELKWVNRALPKMRMAMDLVAAGDQIKQGEGFTAEEVGVWTQEVQEVATLAVGEDDQGNVQFADIGPAINAQGIRSELGLEGGAPQQESGRYSDRNDLLSDLGRLFGFVPSSVCSVATNPWFGAAVTIATLGSATLADFAIDGAVLAAGALWIDDLVRIAAGVEVNPEEVGANLGNHANDGAKLAANEQAVAFGGRELTGTETVAWEARRDNLIAEENSQKPFMERYFSFSNPRSMASMTLMRMPVGYSASITDIFTSPFTAMASIFSPVQAQENYDYGFPRFGFSIGELEDINYDNPYENVDILERTADIDLLHETIGRDCFDLEIIEDENGGTFTTREGTHYFGSEGLIERCSEARSQVSNEIFTRYRFYLLDTMMMTSMACYEGLETFCEELGFGAAASSGGGVNVEGAIVGNPYESSVDVACDPRTIDLGIGEGFVQQTLTPMRLCAIPNIPSVADESSPGNRFYVEGANGYTIVNSRVSGAWFALGESARLDGVSLSAQSTFRTQEKQEALWVQYGMDTSRVARPGNSPHQAGAAIDFTTSGGTRYISGASCNSPAFATDETYEWLRANAFRFGFGQYAAEAWHWDPSTAANRCRFLGDLDA